MVLTFPGLAWYVLPAAGAAGSSSSSHRPWLSHVAGCGIKRPFPRIHWSDALAVATAWMILSNSSASGFNFFQELRAAFFPTFLGYILQNSSKRLSWAVCFFASGSASAERGFSFFSSLLLSSLVWSTLRPVFSRSSSGRPAVVPRSGGEVAAALRLRDLCFSASRWSISFPV